MSPGVVSAKYRQVSISTIGENKLSSSQNSSVLFFAGLVVGGLVGAGLALLLAPQSGEETRGQIRAKSFELKDQAAEGLSEAGQRAQAQADAWQEKGQEVTGAIGRSKDRVVEAARWPDKD